MTDLDRCFAIAIDGVERSEIGAAFSDRRCLWNTTLIDRFLKETPGSNLVALGVQQKIDGVAVTVDRAVEIPRSGTNSQFGRYSYKYGYLIYLLG